MSLQDLSNRDLSVSLEKLVEQERHSTVEIVAHIQEIDRRRLYIELGYTSLFGYLTGSLGYTPAAAQRRIDAARLMHSVPELRQDLQSGALNLMQAALVGQGVRQKKRENVTVSVAQKRELLERIKGKSIEATQKIMADVLDLPVIVGERIQVQRDESVRVELTLSKTEMETVKRAKELISHARPGASTAELLVFLANDYVKRKDPLVQKPKAANAPNSPRTSTVEVAAHQPGKRVPVPAETRKHVFQRDRYCQWRDPKTGKICGSRFQLQMDHKFPVRSGGGNEPENLQLLCSVHNGFKYRQEVAT